MLWLQKNFFSVKIIGFLIIHLIYFSNVQKLREHFLKGKNGIMLGVTWKYEGFFQVLTLITRRRLQMGSMQPNQKWLWNHFFSIPNLNFLWFLRKFAKSKQTCKSCSSNNFCSWKYFHILLPQIIWFRGHPQTTWYVCKTRVRKSWKCWRQF